MTRSPARTIRPARVLVACVLLGLASQAWALSPTFGVGLAPFTGGWPVVDLSASLQVAEVEVAAQPVGLGVRADLAFPLDFRTYPAVALSVTAATAVEGIEPFVGTGLGLGWRALAGEQTAVATWIVLAGVRVPIDDAFAARIEAVAAPLVGGVSLIVGVDWTPWR